MLKKIIISSLIFVLSASLCASNKIENKINTVNIEDVDREISKDLAWGIINTGLACWNIYYTRKFIQKKPDLNQYSFFGPIPLDNSHYFLCRLLSSVFFPVNACCYFYKSYKNYKLKNSEKKEGEKDVKKDIVK